jgi:hypothetical protein
MPKQQTQQERSAPQENGAKLTSIKKRAPRQTVPVKDRLRVIISAPDVRPEGAHFDDDTSTRPWFFNPILLYVLLALLAIAAIEIFVFMQL